MVSDEIERYLDALPGPATWERVREDFWYVRLPGTARRWIPVELELGQRTLKATSHFCIEPEERGDEAYRFLLAHNLRATGVSFASDGERTICIVGRLPRDEVDAPALDGLLGKIVDLTETTFQGFLRIGFASRFPR